MDKISGRSPKSDEELLLDIIIETAAVFFKMRAIGKQLSATTSWGGGSWGLLRSLIVDGPQTVPQLAASRPVARQRIQLIANELAAAGLVAFIDNPAHRRSKLVSVTGKGERHYEQVRIRILGFFGQMAGQFDHRDLQATASTMHQVEAALSAWLERHPEKG